MTCQYVLYDQLHMLSCFSGSLVPIVLLNVWMKAMCLDIHPKSTNSCVSVYNFRGFKGYRSCNDYRCQPAIDQHLKSKK